MRILLMCLVGTVSGSVKLMARERARKGEETLAGREVFCFEENYFQSCYQQGGVEEQEGTRG